MTDYKATPENWKELERWAEANQLCTASCIIELRARVEALETMRETEKAAVLDLYQQHDKLKEWVGKNYMRIRALEDEPEPISEEENDRRFQACMKLIHEATPEQIQAGSLVRRVALAISGIEYGLELDEEAVHWASEARAAIREVAEWLNNRGQHMAVTILLKEAKR
jgi:hypothetical protein